MIFITTLYITIQLLNHDIYVIGYSFQT